MLFGKIDKKEVDALYIDTKSKRSVGKVLRNRRERWVFGENSAGKVLASYLLKKENELTEIGEGTKIYSV